jgi:two-component system, OmpR family, sensor histidine kinase KdpD
MRQAASSPLLERPRRSPVVGAIVVVVLVAATTAVIYPLKEAAPLGATGVVYLLAVLAVASAYGLWLGLVAALASAAAFNWFHIPPTGQFTVAKGEDWVALGVLLAVAIVASTVSERLRSRADAAELRRREADLAADMARSLLSAETLERALPAASERFAQTLDLPWAQIVAGEAEPGDHVAVPLDDEGRRVGTLLLPASLSDTARRRLQERLAPALAALLAAALERDRLQREVVENKALRRSDEIKTALLRAVSHDLRSPLTAIMTAGEALGSTSLSDDERSELAGSVSDQARRLSGLVDKLLDFSRLQAGGAVPRSDWVSLEEVIHVAAEEQRAAGVEVSEAIDPDLPLVRADAAQLERALANLLENAARYSDGHPVIVRSKAVARRILIRVVDRGPGIPASELHRIFEPFQRGARGGDGAPAGSGLGLAIVKALIEANGGKVWAESSASGTTFVIAFPLPARAGEPVPA